MEKPPAEPPLQTDWTSIAPAHADLDEHIGNEDVTAEEIARRADSLMTSVFKVFEHELFTGPPPPFHLLAPADADWSQAVPWSLGRVQAINASGAPRMRVVHWKALEALGRIPRWPEDAAYIIDLEDLYRAWIAAQDAKGKVGGKVLCVTMFSHRWSRPSLDPSEAHPDTVDGIKCQSLVEYGRGAACGVFPYHPFDYFFWIDFAGVHQTNRLCKTLGVAALPIYVAGSHEICFFYTPTYEGRAWTRLERVIGYAFNPAPMFVLIDEDYHLHKTMPSLSELAATNECFELNPSSGGIVMAINDPLGEGAGITDPHDQALVEKLLTLCLKAPPLNGALKSSYGMQHAGLDLSACKFAVDIEHYKLDCERARQVLEKRERSMMEVQSK